MRLRALALAGLSAVLLTACGGGTSSTDPDAGSSASSAAPSTSDQTGPELAAAAADALEEAGSVRMQGTMALEGMEAAIDFHLQGADAIGTMTLDGQAMQIIVTGGAFYMQAAAPVWAAQGVPPEIAARLADTWVAAPPGAGAQFGDFSLAGFVGELRRPSDGPFDGEVRRGEVDGEPVWVVTQADGSVTMIAAEGPPYPIRGAMKGPEGGQVTFSDFGVTKPITAPADFVDLGQLGA